MKSENIFILILAMSMLSACGQTGRLYMPTNEVSSSGVRTSSVAPTSTMTTPTVTLSSIVTTTPTENHSLTEAITPSQSEIYA